ncbi:hypothetical protein FBUS_11343 [Fasciolopsis buskii]|uniref:CCHC-type domain-containing protein n=1 Tax=Fasciolopsis buskii TaxID=27845 RepID=A0A8E0S827_9TREM|nr:hypothetical protein FBUS_11343 [Fasciolopsis buski]
MDRPRGPSSSSHRNPLTQSSVLDPSKTRPSVSVDPPVVTVSDLIQPTASWVGTDVHPHSVWPAPVNGIQQTQQRLSFRRELTPYLPAALPMRPGPNYQNRGFHTSVHPTPGPTPFLTPIFNGAFPTRSFLHPSAGNVVTGSSTILYHQNSIPTVSFSQTALNTSFAAHVSTTQPVSTSVVGTQATTTFLSNFPGQLFAHPPSDLPSSFPHPPPPMVFVNTSSSAFSVVNNISVDSTPSLSTCVSTEILTGSVTCPVIQSSAGVSSASTSPPPTSEAEVGSNNPTVHLSQLRTTVPCSHQTLTTTLPSTASGGNLNTSGGNLSTNVISLTPSSVSVPPFLPSFYMHQPPLLPPPPPPPPAHLNYFLPQSAPLIPPHAQHPNLPMPLWTSLPLAPAAAVAPLLASHTMNSRHPSCFNCGQPGHKAKCCPSRLPNQQAIENTFNLSYAPNK